MASLTLRDLTDEMLAKIRILAEVERRSLNRQFLVILEDGLEAHLAAMERGRDAGPRPGLQVALWREMVGQWEDERTTQEIVADIRGSRTDGRDVGL